MADIDVVKKRNSVWPWIIGLIVLALVIWLLMGMMGAGTVTDPAPAVWLPQMEPLAAALPVQGMG